MKKLFISTFIFCTAIAVMAKGGVTTTNTSESIKIFSTTENTVSVISDPSDLGTIAISIIDDRNNLVFKNFLNTKRGFLERYNLESLRPGKYNVIVAKGKEIISQKEVLVHYTIFMMQPLGDNKYEVSFSNYKSEFIKLSILDINNNEISSVQINQAQSFSQIYDLSEIKHEVRAFQFTSLDSGYSETLALK
ncbi:MAG: hypothetical protein ACJA08_000088 [Cyclobacteriaceae bacterium]|jgi:hypothetical protein